jgi:hypothetical protein
MIHTIIGWNTKTLIPNSCVLFGNSTVQKQLELITSDKCLFDKCIEFCILYFGNWIIQWFWFFNDFIARCCMFDLTWKITTVLNNLDDISAKHIKSNDWKRTCWYQMLTMTLLEKNDVNYICFTCQVIRFNKQFYSRMFHSVLVQDIFNQFYLF